MYGAIATGVPEGVNTDPQYRFAHGCVCDKCGYILCKEDGDRVFNVSEISKKYKYVCGRCADDIFEYWLSDREVEPFEWMEIEEI